MSVLDEICERRKMQIELWLEQYGRTKSKETELKILEAIDELGYFQKWKRSYGNSSRITGGDIDG